jgi:phage-related protein
MPIFLNIVSKFDPKGQGDAERGMKELGSKAGGVALGIGAAFAAAAVGAGYLGIELAKAAAESEAVTRGLENALKNSGNFGDSAGSISVATKALTDHSKALGEMAGINDETINKLKARWSAVPEIAATGVDGINKLATVSADIAAGTGKDIETIGLMFAKVAGDEESAMSKLQRAGIVLTDEQKAIYDQILTTNGEVDAQAYLIETLGTKYAGMAEATANPFDQLQEIFKNLSEEIGTYLLPAIKNFVDKIQDFIKTHGPELKDVMTKVGDAVQVMVDGFMGFIEFYSQNSEIINNLAITFGIIAGVIFVVAAAFWAWNAALYANPIVLIVMAFIAALAILAVMITLIITYWDEIIAGIVAGWNWLVGIITTAWDAVMSFFTDAFGNIGKMFEDVWNGIGDFFKGVINGLIGMFEGFINFFIDGLNGLIGPLNSLLDGIATATGGAIDLNIPKLSKVSIPRLADGGVVLPSPGGSLVNVAEGGQAEAIIPLDRLGGIGGARETTINITVNGGLDSSTSIGERIVEAIKRYERSNGSVFVSA